MRVPLELTCRNIEKTDSIEALVQEKVAKLEQVCNYITSCRIAIEKPHRHKSTGNLLRVRIDITVPPGHEIVINEEREDKAPNDLTVVVRESFSIARRQLKKLVEKQQGRIKTHPQQEMQAVVSKIVRDEGYGFIKTIDNREVYFHQNSVLHGDFDRLEIGTGVRFVEEAGEQGPQATTVQIVDKPGVRISRSRSEE